MKGKKVEILWNKIRLTGCKWSNLNAPMSETPVSHSLLSDSLFPNFQPVALGLRIAAIRFQDRKVARKQLSPCDGLYI